MKTTFRSSRKKMNFMISDDLIMEITIYIPSGERSDFVNEAIDHALARFKQKKAFEAMANLRKKHKLHLSTKEFIRLKNEGRP